MSSNFLLYGATGYTGDLIARFASDRGLRPILAARNTDKLEQTATELGLDYRAFSLDDPDAIETALAEVQVVLNCAGPFFRTYQPIVEACLRTQTHYLDITGEIPVFEALADRDAEAKEAGIMLLPGVGFDVVPSDCLAAHLKTRLPSATHLALGFQMRGGRMSRGTATTMVESSGSGGMVRQDGNLTPVSAGWKTREIDFGQGPVSAMTIPWGDVSTAFYSTGIPNIEVYAAFPDSIRTAIALSRYFGWFLNLPPIKHLQKRWIKAQPPGPTDAERAAGQSLLWGTVEDNTGDRVVSRLQCPEGYTLTALAALKIVEKVLGGQVSVGFQTPSLAYGADLILDIADVRREDLPA